MTTAGSEYGPSLPDAATGPAVPARLARRRLRAHARFRVPARWRLSDIYFWAVLTAVGGAMTAGSLRPLARLMTGPGWAVPGGPSRLFAVASVLLLLGVLTQLLLAAGPVTASSAFRFWLLATPVGRRELLGRRFSALIAVVAVVACVVVALVAHAASVAVLPAVAAAALAAVTVTAGAVWGQASQVAEHVVHVIGRALSAVSVLGFGSLATGVGRAEANSVLRAPPAAVIVLVAMLAVAALAGGWNAWRALGRIEVSVLRRGQGLWMAGQVASVSLDAFMLADFLAEQRARSAGRARPARIRRSFALALPQLEWTRLRRRPSLALRAGAAAVVWWGCRPAVPPPALAAMAVIIGYFLVLPLAGTLRQLASAPGLRAQFAPRDRWLARASASMCLLGAAVWATITAPGLASHGTAVIAVIIALGLTAAAWRTATRPPLDYTKPPVPTPVGDLPLDLWRQVLRGPLLLLVLAVLVAHIA